MNEDNGCPKPTTPRPETHRAPGVPDAPGIPSIRDVVNAHMRTMRLDGDQLDAAALAGLIRELGFCLGSLDGKLDASNVPWKLRAQLITAAINAGFAEHYGRIDHGRKCAVMHVKFSRTAKLAKASKARRAKRNARLDS